ncbi:hypothetical protein [Enterobacter chuandaensis]|uniref:hypothetical protein n=1 Tax=Enterobacter chuandaensis TaxID=2497875 RepID=UPI000E75458D|nr:hypothetical protein [Enterobacter chuandaensis]RJL02700.1 hypothetical protein D5066_09155 [Enterobacter chuandaensis]
MEKYSKEYMDNLANIAACIVGAGIAASQMIQNTMKRNSVLEKQKEALIALEEFGYSLHHQQEDIGEIKCPEYLVVDIHSGMTILKFNEGYNMVTWWYHKLTSY